MFAQSYLTWKSLLLYKSSELTSIIENANPHVRETHLIYIGGYVMDETHNWVSHLIQTNNITNMTSLVFVCFLHLLATFFTIVLS